MSVAQEKFNLNRVVFIGRTLSEYKRMFDIEMNSLNGLRVLDCPSGASSFTAEANSSGINVVGCDIFYEVYDSCELEEIGLKDIEYIMHRVSLNPERYKWEYYKSIHQLREYRLRSLNGFIHDYPLGTELKRYVKAVLPKLPFEQKSFDIVLSGNFLFNYAGLLSYEFHLLSILEMLRISRKEVRMFPIHQLNATLPSFLDNLIRDIKKNVQHEFLKGANKMLRLIHGS